MKHLIGNWLATTIANADAVVACSSYRAGVASCAVSLNAEAFTVNAAAAVRKTRDLVLQ